MDSLKEEWFKNGFYFSGHMAVASNAQAMWHMGERVIPRALAGKQMSSGSCADQTPTTFWGISFSYFFMKLKHAKILDKINIKE